MESESGRQQWEATHFSNKHKYMLCTRTHVPTHAHPHTHRPTHAHRPTQAHTSTRTRQHTYIPTHTQTYPHTARVTNKTMKSGSFEVAFSARLSRFRRQMNCRMFAPSVIRDERTSVHCRPLLPSRYLSGCERRQE